MITAHFDRIVNQLRNYSKSLAIENIFVDKPWTIIDEDNEMQRLIFKKDRSLIMSKNGQVNKGSWDYLPEAKSIVINRINDSILCNEAYIDEGVMILRLDGTANQFFTLANENIIPDLDVYKYMANKRQEKLNIEERRLIDGKLLEIDMGQRDFPAIGHGVSINLKEVADGKYQLAHSNEYYEIISSKIIQIIIVKAYENPEGIEFTVHQRNNYQISVGDLVFVNDILVKNQTINFSHLERLVVSDGKVVKLEYKNVLLREYPEVVLLLFVIALLLIIYFMIHYLQLSGI
jgi:hypothetical protein